MRIFIASLLVAGQLAFAAQPTLAATMGPGEQTRVGAFGGVQIRIPLGGTHAEAPRASLGIAPTVHSQRIDGSSRTRVGEGLQLSLEPNGRPEFNLAGTRLDRLGMTPGGQTPDGEKAGVSTLGWVGIGVGVVAVVGVVVFTALMNSCAEHDDEC